MNEVGSGCDGDATATFRNFTKKVDLVRGRCEHTYDAIDESVHVMRSMHVMLSMRSIHVMRSMRAHM